MRISDFLSHGADNAVGLRALANMARLSEREVRQQIQRERLNGIPICSDNKNGYYLPASAGDKKQCVRSLRHRAAAILKVAAALETAEVE